MPHDIEVVAQAIDKMLVYEREVRDAAKMEQYGGAKTSFYPSELGNGDRKIVYGFFKDRIGAQSTFTGQNARVFDNGDYVHTRYRDYMIRLGALLTEEQSLKIEQHDFERAPSAVDGGYRMSGRYDQIIDLNVVRAYVTGIEAWEQFLAANYEKHEIITTTLDASAGSILEELKTTRWFPKAGYTPDPMIIDIKSMNPWGFKALAEKNDHSSIQGYIDQVNAYEDKLGIHKGGLLVEDKEKNRLHPVPVDYDPNRIHGNDVHEGISNRLGRLWNHVKAGTVPEERCAGANVSKFPCKWSTGQCDFFSHCWNDEHQGRVIPGVVAQAAEEEVELPSIEEIIEYLAEPEKYQVSAIILYLKDFPGGQDRFTVTKEMPEAMLHQMLDFYADFVFDLDYVDLEGNIQRAESEEEKIDNMMDSLKETAPAPVIVTVPVGEDGVTMTATFESDANVPAAGADPLVNADGTFNFEPGASVIERVRTDGSKEINCGKCGNLIIYKVLRGAKECTSCKHRNVVTRA